MIDLRGLFDLTGRVACVTGASAGLGLQAANVLASAGAQVIGVAQLTRAMAEAWSADGITANAIGPGFFPTDLTQAVFADPARVARNAAQTCVGRNGQLDDINGPLLFLCTDASAYVIGQILMVDGGFTAK